jgi:SAM-dependent methyltransferase
VFSRYLAASGWKVIAFDGSPEMIRRAVECPESDSIEYLVNTIEEYPGVAADFDAIISFSLLEYVNDDAAALDKLTLLLKPGGILVLSAPNRNGVFRRAERVASRIRGASGQRLFGSHGAYLEFQKHQYVPRDLDAALAARGMRRVRSVFLSSGLRLPRLFLPIFERGWWAALYCAAYARM